MRIGSRYRRASRLRIFYEVFSMRGSLDKHIRSTPPAQPVITGRRCNFCLQEGLSILTVVYPDATLRTIVTPINFPHVITR
jgi:hypothetical protein